jgi:hypothetical protein
VVVFSVTRGRSCGQVGAATYAALQWISTTATIAARSLATRRNGCPRTPAIDYGADTYFALRKRFRAPPPEH